VDGRHNRPSHPYQCPRSQGQNVGIESCSTKYLHGVTTDQLVWENVSPFLSDPQTFLTEMDRQRRDSDSGEATVTSNIAELESKLRNVDKMETELVWMKLRGQASDEAFKQQGALLRAERVYYQDEIGRQKAELQTLTQATEALETVAD